ncbi:MULTISPECIES: LacI family DNA-binding transcriptional regulator [Alphaproteobacteria]|uniref:LacI family transcriptional regulator n=2 Tax=Alphaproteobacteria TaxID=28211 RepID=A0A512HJ33_9HYPH|nr:MULTISPECIES: LacI family DNA-binding transcriptional regulator [Alphaproteobacteria]GEO85447.1 LacI family transcriptional regulator [Ciceribacter naphthalenivorans]GLR21531.1 LacI family transcriptional regulator [Ciceribacter naphthalenivorans]GLT04387.1 LacI family transcriptional regulator [Sphingomonas psychrolutea]
MKPTVHDIAAAAGVSLATVDRVLNQRPGVSARTREKVEAAVVALGFVRDVAAANLAKGRVYSLTFILPSNDNSFMRELEKAIGDATVRSPAERTDIRIVKVPPFDAAALVKALDAVCDERPAGVALVAVDAPEVVAAVDRLVEAGIPVVTLVSDVPASRRVHYAGIDNLAAGRTAASLLGRFVGERSGAIAILAGSLLVRDHRERLDGFRSVMADNSRHLVLLDVIEGRDDPTLVERQLTELFRSRADIRGVYSLGAGNRGLAAALRKAEVPQRPAVIAHELTETTRSALCEGLVDAVLNQDAGHEVRSAIRVLKATADGLPVLVAQERIRIDIFLKDNLP